MSEQEEQKPRTSDSLEDTDDAESMRQLWWTLASIVVGLIVISLIYS